MKSVKVLIHCFDFQISMKAHIENCSQAATLVSAILRGDAKLLGSALGEFFGTVFLLDNFCLTMSNSGP